MFEVREKEPAYAFVPQVDAPEQNRYGKPIQLVDKNDPLAGKSLNINNDSGIGSGENRYKQHGFFFKADHCIACHACEAACSEKNDLPAHISFRSVGYVEGGSYPAYQRLNISMACNHCDDPVCLKGCPTRAYTKFAEYGAVLQDPDICFGCGYCTWVCPYNAPQLDPVKGEVSKCNMCVDRLEVGLKPACVSACLAGALDFGIIETTPENRDQLEASIPGFPTPDITHPNIRFEQTSSLPREMRRTDSIPLRYERDEQGKGEYKSKVAEGQHRREWNLNKLRSREDPLVIFTLVSQAVVGAFMMLFLIPFFGSDVFANPALSGTVTLFLFALIGMETFALALSTMHLGKPQRFYRAFNNLRYSPVSREIAGIAVFYTLLCGYTLTSTQPWLFTWLLPESLVSGLATLCGWGAVIAGPAAIYFMHAIYRIKARPFWNHWQVLTSFYGNTLSLGALFTGLVFAFTLALNGQSIAALMSVLAWPVVTGLMIESLGLIAHTRHLDRSGEEGAASHYQQTTKFGNTWLLRNTGLCVAVLAVTGAAIINIDGLWGMSIWIVIGLIVTVTAVIGRALFYVLVIPTTMPGAFFWKNPGFEEHARETGLAEMPQVGVLPDVH
jgi:DMSO reductase iron-sulfur subunit